jgi:chemotaxis protein CheZ
MSSKRKRFKIEDLPTLAEGTSPPIAPANNHNAAIMAELAEIKAMITSPEVAERNMELASQRMVDAYRSELNEAAKLKAEIDEMCRAITETKHEIATLHNTGFKGKEMRRVTSELDAVVDGTQEATEGILSCAEEIDQICATLGPHLKNEQDRGMVEDIQGKVVTIFENCNFQDLTGQRVTKVVNTLKFIEERIVRMMDIWGGIESFREVAADVMPEKEGDSTLLNGPKLNADQGHVSQDDIDALFD